MIWTCKRCGREREIYAKKLCSSCYHMKHVDMKKLLKRNDNWHKEHKNYWKDYYYANREKLSKRVNDWQKKQREKQK